MTGFHGQLLQCYTLYYINLFRGIRDTHICLTRLMYMMHTHIHTYVREKEDNMDVCDWLREFLRDGPKEVSEIKSAAKAAGYTRGGFAGG